MLRLVLLLGSVCVPTLLASYGFKDLLPFGLSISEAPANPFIPNHSEHVCRQNEFNFLSSAEKLELKHGTRLVAPGQLQRFQNGFFKSTCFPETLDYEMEEQCIFVNPTTSNGKGMVIIASEKLLKKSFDMGLNLSDDPVDPEAMKVVKVPEKGGMGAVAARKIQMGDPVVLERPVGLFPSSNMLWYSEPGMKIRRQAIDHLPTHTRAAVARLHGQGETEDEFLSDVVDKNVFSTNLPGEEEMSYGALVLDGSRLNHACRPNVAYYIDDNTQLFHMNALEPMEAGTELTDSYRGLSLPRDERHESLKRTYGFECTCPVCQMSHEEAMVSDERIERMRSLLSEDIYSADDLEELLRLTEMEKIPWYKVYANYNAAQFYNSQGKTQKVKEHALVAKKFGLILAGPTWDLLDEINMLLVTPDQHPSHFSQF